MKIQQVFLSLTLFITVLSFGQNNTFPTPSGNVGIGTTTPGFSLEINKWTPGVADLLRLRNTYASSSAQHGVSILLDGFYSQAKISSYENPQATYGGNLQLQTYNGSGVLNTGIVLDRSGNVGIGTATPSANLEISKLNSNLMFDVNTNDLCKIVSKGWNANIDIHTFTGIGAENVNQLVLNTNGNIGIGTANPVNKLEVNGNIAVGGPSVGSDASPLSKKIAAYNYQSIEAGAIDFLDFNSSRHATSIAFRAKNASNVPQEFMRIVGQDGNVGIGTKNPDEKLTVNGTIHATKVKVTATVPADYVFQKYYTGTSDLKSDYAMPTLAEIESFTKKNNHLPNIPSAKEMQAKGVDLGEMNNLLLQKVEELTLYAIEQQKELERLKTENENYKSLAERLTAIEQQLKK